MSRYDHLPIWNDAMKLSVGIERAVMQFSRYHKYALGAELRRTAQAVLGGIVRAVRARFAPCISARFQFHPPPNPLTHRRKET